MNEDMILSEYLDGELPSDLSAMVRERLARDAAFKARYEAMAALRGRLRADAGLDPVALADMQARVWQRLQRNLSPRPSRIPAWIAALGDLVSIRVSLPVPALAALALVFVAVGFVAVARPGATGGSLSVAGAEAATVLSVEGQSGMLVDQMGVTPASFQASAAQESLTGQSNGMALTLEGLNMRQLLSILENNQGIREFTIRLPEGKTLQPVGDPALFSAAELEPGKVK
jgi:anti-sigma factor RsiW